jgi:hypothetical protein
VLLVVVMVIWMSISICVLQGYGKVVVGIRRFNRSNDICHVCTITSSHGDVQDKACDCTTWGGN